MKKYLFIITVAGLILTNSCDSLEHENHIPQNELESGLDVGSSADENLRKNSQGIGNVTKRASRNYDLMENAYYEMVRKLKPNEIERIKSTSRSKRSFVVKMMGKSTELFDQNILNKSKFLSAYAVENLKELIENNDSFSGDEHEISYDIAAGVRLNNSSRIDERRVLQELGKFRNESTFQFFKHIRDPKIPAAGCGPYCDSLPPIKKPELEDTYKFLLEVESSNAEPSRTEAGIIGLEINSGVDPRSVALLLPAVQSAREAARVNARGKADILLESLGSLYGINMNDKKGELLKYGGSGSILALISEDYEPDGDLDWSTVQLNRSKFKFEMFFFWSEYWDSK